MVSGMVRQMLHEVRQTDLFCVDRKHPSQGFVRYAIHKLDLFSLDFRHFNCTAARSGNAFGLNRALCVPVIFDEGGAGDGSSNTLASRSTRHVHERVSHRTEAAAQISVNSSALRVEAACNTMLFASGRTRRVAECHLWSW